MSGRIGSGRGWEGGRRSRVRAFSTENPDPHRAPVVRGSNYRWTAMDLSVSRNLSVTVTDHSTDKLREKQQMLRERIQRVESKALGVSQVMVGLMIMSYSLPLLFTNFTQVVTFGVPWWSGTMFIAAGAVAIETEKRGSMNFLRVCLLVTLVATVTSVLALIFYSVDLHVNNEKSCELQEELVVCGPEHYCQAFSRGLKSCLLLFTVTQMVISLTLVVLLYKERRSFTEYMSLTENMPSMAGGSSPLDLN
ncbi:membrane-spanning 4-domains subfamily A member 12-like [Arapaima gigas]